MRIGFLGAVFILGVILGAVAILGVVILWSFLGPYSFLSYIPGYRIASAGPVKSVAIINRFMLRSGCVCVLFFD